MNYFENYRAGHELFVAYCNFVHDRASAYDAKICDQYDVQPWDVDAAERVDEIIRDDHESGASDYAYEQYRDRATL